MNWSRVITRLLSRTTGLTCSLLVSVVSYSQTDSTDAVPKTFVFSKYQLQGHAAVSFFSVPLQASPYKIHYKIKTLTFPADTRPERPVSIANAVVNGIIETATKRLLKDDCEEQNKFLVPLKPTNTYKY